MKTTRVALPVNKGMNTDAAHDLLPPGTLRDTVGMQSRRAGDIGRLTLMDTATDYAVLPEGYTSVAQVVIDDTAVLFLRHTNNLRCQIVQVRSDGSITTLFDDETDVNGDRLRFPDRPFDIRLNQEIDSRIDLYWTDGVNPPRVLRLGTPITSVHSLSEQGEARVSRCKYLGLGTGTLLQGFYKFCYRYSSQQTVTPPLGILSRHVALSAKQPYAEMPEAMGASGIVTDRGFSVMVEVVDTRWPTVELLVCYSPDNITYTDLVVADRQATTGLSSATLWCRSNAGVGEGLPLSEVAQYYQPIRSSEVMSFHSKRLVHGNVRLGVPVSPLVGRPTLEVLHEYRPVEDPTLPSKASLSGDIALAQRTPLVGNRPVTTTLYDQLYINKNGAAVNVEHPVSGETLDYAGNQFDVSRGDYRAGETYPIAAVVFDLLGQPTFAYDLGVFAPANLWQGVLNTVTNQVEVPSRLTRQNNDGTTDIAHLGLLVNNLVLRDELLRDDQGRLVVSAIAIVRGEAAGRLGPQGILLNTVYEEGGRVDMIAPLPTFRNVFDNQSPPELANVPLKGPSSPGKYRMDGSLMTFHSPDLLANPALLDDKPQATRIITQAGMRPVLQANQGVLVQQTGWHQYIVKAYKFIASGTRAAPGRNGNGDSAAILNSTPLVEPGTPDVMEGVYPRRTDLKFSTISYPILRHPYTGVSTFGQAWVGSGKLLAVDRRLAVDAGEDGSTVTSNATGYMLASVERGVDTLPSNSIKYQSTGHIMPITESVLNTLPTQTIDGKLHYTINGIHVWGGDTYRQRVGIVLQRPMYADDASQTDLDYGIGVVTVMENHYNHQKRTGRRWETVGFESMKTAYNGEAMWMSGGVSVRQNEDWFVNKGLTNEEHVRTYSQLPTGATVRTEWLAGIVWSEQKTDTERYDSLLKYPATNIYLLDGEQGAIVGLHSQTIGLYAVQERGIASVAVEERKVTRTDDGAGLLIASGRDVGPHTYVSRETGAINRMRTWNGDGSFYWIDRRTGDLMRFSQAGKDNLSIRSGMTLNGYLLNGGKVHGAYDAIQKEVHIALAGKRLVYDEVQDVFMSYCDTPRQSWLLPIPTGLSEQHARILSRTGIYYPATPSVSFERCPYPGHQMRWRSALLACSESLAECITSITIDSEKGQQILTGDDPRIRYRHGRMSFPLMALEDGDAIKSDWIKVSFYFSVPQPLYDAYISLLELDFIPSTRQ